MSLVWKKSVSVNSIHSMCRWDKWESNDSSNTNTTTITRQDHMHALNNITTSTRRTDRSAAKEPLNHMESRLALNVVISQAAIRFELAAGKDERCVHRDAFEIVEQFLDDGDRGG